MKVGLRQADGKNILARRLILYIVLFAVATTIVLAAIHSYVEYRQRINAIHSHLSQIETSNREVVAGALWTADKEQLNTILRGITELPDIEYAEVRVNGELFSSVGTEPLQGAIAVTFPLRYRHRSRLLTVGEMSVVAEQSRVWQHFMSQAWSLLVYDAIEIAIIALFIYLLVTRLITRHLYKMAAFAGKLVIDNFESRLDLERKRQSAAAPDEIDILAATLSRMQASLGTSVSELKQKESHINLLMESVGEGIYGIDPLGNCIFANTACAQMLGWENSNELLGRNMHQLMHYSHQDGSGYSGEDCKICQAHLQGVSAHAEDEAFWRRDGASFPIEYRSQPIIYEDRILGTVVSFNDISERKEAERKLRKTHEELEDRVLQRTEALSKAKDEAEMANRAKTVFLSSMSHELRTPLNAILGFAQLLELDADQMNEAQCEALEHILNGGRLLLELINDVLDLAKIESGNLALSIEDIPVMAILEDAVQMIRAMAAENDISVDISCPGSELPLIRADHIRLKQVVLNFLTNAIKYNRKGGRVTVEFEVIPERFLRILVNDTGEGIPARYQCDLFKPFSRLGAEAGTIEGTGVGLAVSKELIKLMEGNLGFESEEDQGSTFWFELPLARDLKSGANTVMPHNDDQDHSVDRSDTAYPGARKVLYIEDNPANLKLMKNIIAQIPGLRFIAAQSAKAGIALAEREKPDLILMDINLPGMNGHEALGKLKQNAETAQIPVIAVTANAMNSHLEKAEQSAFVSYITKPFDVADIIKSIKHLVKGM